MVQFKGCVGTLHGLCITHGDIKLDMAVWLDGIMSLGDFGVSTLTLLAGSLIKEVRTSASSSASASEGSQPHSCNTSGVVCGRRRHRNKNSSTSSSISSLWRHIPGFSTLASWLGLRTEGPAVKMSVQLDSSGTTTLLPDLLASSQLRSSSQYGTPMM